MSSFIISFFRSSLLGFICVLLLSGMACSSTAPLSEDDHHTPGEPLSVEKLWEMKRIGSPVISPNGDWVVAPVTEYDVDDDSSLTRLWIFKADGSVERPLTGTSASASQPVFSPDGSQLAFVSARNEDSAPQLYVLPLDMPGEAGRITEVPTGVSAPKWVGEHLYFISNVFPEMSWEEMSEKLAEQGSSHVSAHKWTELPYSFWDRWLEEERQAHLYRIPADGGDTEAITLPTGRELPRGSQGTGSYDVAPDESQVAFVSNTTRSDVDREMDIYLVTPGSDSAENITPENEAPDGSPLFSPDGRHMAYTSQQIRGFYADKQRLMIYDLQAGTHQYITEGWDRSAGGLVWAPDAMGLYGSIDDAGTRRIYYFDVRGNAPQPITGETSYPSVAVSETGVLAAQNHSFMHPPQVHIVNAESGSSTRLDSINDDVMADVAMGTYESVTYEGANGEEIQMWVHYPPGFDKSKEYPLFLLIHGGPHSGITDGFHFRWNAQTYASWGYVTAWHNFHGSSGFGQDFTDSINPDWISKPYEDTIKAGEWFAEKDWIDETRMVAGGGSYGGYLSSILLGKPHPFNSLVIHAPVYNMYSQMSADFVVHAERFGQYWEEEQREHFDGNTIYEQISPHYYAEDFDTPALIIHGQQDLRVPVGQAFELFRTLQSKDIDSRLIYFPDENHWILNPNNSIYWYHQVRDWVEKYAAPGGE